MTTERNVYASITENSREYGRRFAYWANSLKFQVWLLRAIYVVLAINLIALGLYLFHGYMNYFHTDASTKNLLAQEMWETGKFFPRDWNYVNRDLMVIFGQLPILPLLTFFRNGFILHAISGLIFATAILASTWKLTALLSDVRWQRLMTVTVLAGGVSTITAENIFGQVAYGVVLLLSSIVILVGWWALQANGRRLHAALATLAMVVFLVTWNNPQRALISYLVPLFAAIAAYVLWGGSVAEMTRRLRRAVPVCMVVGLGVIAGAVCSAWVIAKVQNSNGVAVARWLDYDGFVNNLVNSVKAVMAMFGGIPIPGAEVVSLYGAYASVRLVASITLIFLIPWAIARALKADRPELRFFAAFLAIQLVASLFLFVTTTIPDMSDPVSSGRYLAPSVLFGLILLFTLRLPREAPIRNFVMIGLMCIFATNSIVRLGREAMPVRSHIPERVAVVDALRANKLEYGYASYWNSGVYTVLSEGDSRVRQIQIIDGLPVPMRHLGSNRWYETKAWKGSTFLLLDNVEESRVNWEAMRARMGSDPQRIEVGHLAAFVYPMNIAEKMPHWSRSFENTVTFPAVPGGMYIQGRWDEDKKAVVSAMGEAGFVAYGPYIHLPKGRYRAEYQVASTGATQDAEVATVDVVYNNASEVAATMPIRSSTASTHVLEFELKNAVDTLELRTHANGEAELSYRGVTLHPLGKDASTDGD